MWTEEPCIPAEQLASISSPTLVVAGDRDAIKLEHTTSLFRAIPGAQLSIIPGASHMFITETPDLVTEVVRGFVSA